MYVAPRESKLQPIRKKILTSPIGQILPPSAKPQNAADSIPAKLLHSSLNKVKHPINVVKWTPEGRRLLTGSSIGEFTLWNGMGFNFETISQVHDDPHGDLVDPANT